MKCRYFLLCLFFALLTGCNEMSGVSSSVSEIPATNPPTIPVTEQAETENIIQPTDSEPLLQSVDDIGIYDSDGLMENYVFSYNNEDFNAVYSYDNWKIIDSYKIRNQEDMKIICQALIDIHPIHNADISGFRDADDMVYEWVQHNIAYDLLPDDSEWKDNAGDVDINPYDQNKNLYDMFLDRQGLSDAD